MTTLFRLKWIQTTFSSQLLLTYLLVFFSPRSRYSLPVDADARGRLEQSKTTAKNLGIFQYIPITKQSVLAVRARTWIRMAACVMSSLSSSSGTVGVAGRCGANCGKINIKDDLLKPPLIIIIWQRDTWFSSSFGSDSISVLILFYPCQTSNENCTASYRPFLSKETPTAIRDT